MEYNHKTVDHPPYLYNFDNPPILYHNIEEISEAMQQILFSLINGGYRGSDIKIISNLAMAFANATRNFSTAIDTYNALNRTGDSE